MECRSTIGTPTFFKSYKLSNDSFVNLILIDTCGQEMAQHCFKLLYKTADCCLLVYDISNRESFDYIEKFFIPTIKQYCENDCKVLLLGNKADLESKRKVSEKEGIDLANKYNYMFIETSSLKNENIGKSFEMMIKVLYKLKSEKNKDKSKQDIINNNNTHCIIN